jgi:hypothetical protein
MAYIGQTTNLKKRLRQHDTQPSYTMARETGQYRPLTKFFRVQVVAHAHNKKTANKAERAAIRQHSTMWPAGYNKTYGPPAASKQVFWIRKHAGTL